MYLYTILFVFGSNTLPFIPCIHFFPADLLGRFFLIENFLLKKLIVPNLFFFSPVATFSDCMRLADCTDLVLFKARVELLLSMIGVSSLTITDCASGMVSVDWACLVAARYPAVLSWEKKSSLWFWSWVDRPPNAPGCRENSVSDSLSSSSPCLLSSRSCILGLKLVDRDLGWLERERGVFPLLPCGFSFIMLSLTSLWTWVPLRSDFYF